MGNYGCLQVNRPADADASTELLLVGLANYMQGQGYIACTRNQAERIVAVVPGESACVVYDEQADRPDVAALDSMARFLSRWMRERCIGVLAADSGLVLRLYRRGRLLDTYRTARRQSGGRGHAVCWKSQLAAGCSLRELTALFQQGQREGRAIFPALREALRLEPGTAYGFSSLEDAQPANRLTLYFRAANVVKQHWWDRWLHPLGRTASSVRVSARRLVSKEPHRK